MKRSKKHPNVFSLSGRSVSQALSEGRSGVKVSDVAPGPIDLSSRRTVRVERSYFELLSREEQEMLVAERNMEINHNSREAYEREVAARVLEPSSDLMEYFLRALRRRIGKTNDTAAGN